MKDIIAKYRPDLKPFEEIYRHLHQNPELSGQEQETAATAAEHLRSLGFEVHTNLGGHGVAGVLRNGAGPTVLVRADMDALPVEEKTGLAYASTKTATDAAGVTRPVMHACGHDTHVASLMASAGLLQAARAHWAGTLVCLFQPAEEQLDGARAMLADGLYDRIPAPAVVLAQHVMRMRTGTVSVRAGRFLTAADAFDVRIPGRGGHGSAPHTCIDPIVAAAAVVSRLQTIVSREVPPGEMAVVTCGSIQAGHAHNIIPDSCDLKLSVRTYDAGIRTRVVESIRRIVEAECDAAGCVEKPSVTLTYSTPATINDGKLVETLKGAFGEYFEDGLVESEPAAASEDFSLLATAVGAPYVMWTFGGVDAETWDDAVQRDVVRELPSNHSPFFAPVIEPTLRTAVDAMAVAAMTFLQRKN
ncbi:peptidase family M20/M25/M40 protein [Aspergillus indologenus CBS 114.80]|uniref:Peptidase family M20/M25/M40 protein n=1 Tax=Aspergillus indologenus CBS 114.80 TaxID=1450541 RepID=A0A2V5HZ07_9EURO|nr:peptidase family M20/M25/M40 protein [Aspergillus indologenus CBS 114.80]